MGNKSDHSLFLDYMSVTPNPTTFPDAPSLSEVLLPNDLVEAFSGPFNNIEALQDALKILFDFRLSLGLEIAALFGIVPPVDLSTCTFETAEAGQKLYDDVFVGLHEGLDLFNMQPMFDMILNLPAGIW